MTKWENVPTPHIEAESGASIAKVVLMPGDPLRAKMIAETFLENVVQFNGVRGMLGYTGIYNGKKVSVMGSGMGMPSIGIYSYELFKFYEVESIIRIGTCGALKEDLDLFDVIVVDKAHSESTYAKICCGIEDKCMEASNEINDRLLNSAKELNIGYRLGDIVSGDVFYKEDDAYKSDIYEKDILAGEMEAFALFVNAKILNKKAACLLTVSDSIINKTFTTALERQNAFTDTIKIALNTAIKL